MLPFAGYIEYCLSAEHQSYDRQRPQSLGVKAERESPAGEAADAEQQIEYAHDDAGYSQIADPPYTGRDGRTLSVDDDMARKSPVTIISTISIGVRMAWPVIIRPVAKNNTWTTLWTIDLNV